MPTSRSSTTLLLTRVSHQRATKHDIAPLDLDALAAIIALQPVSFVYDGDASSTVRYGFIAEDTETIASPLATHDAKGVVSGIDDRAILSVLIRAVQELIATVAGLAERFTTRELTFERAQGEQLTVKTCASKMCASLGTSS